MSNAAAYYIVAEALGVAGAEEGKGLRGLADRVEALGGRLTLESPNGRRNVASRRDHLRTGALMSAWRSGLASATRKTTRLRRAALKAVSRLPAVSVAREK
jgi:hypothetical protein